MRAAMPRAAIALGCDPDLGLTVSELCGLTFADVALSRDRARVTTFYRGTAADTSIIARPGDPACPVAALKELRAAVHRNMRSDHGGKAPTDNEIGSASVFANAKTGDPLSRPGLRKVRGQRMRRASPACPDPETGHAPRAERLAQRRRRRSTPTMAAKTIRDLALMSHTAFASPAGSAKWPGSESATSTILGEDTDGMRTSAVPLVDQTEADGTYHRPASSTGSRKSPRRTCSTTTAAASTRAASSKGSQNNLYCPRNQEQRKATKNWALRPSPAIRPAR